MEQTTEQPHAEQTQAPPASPELTRAVSGRLIAGVGQGIANRYGIPAWLPRLVFIVTSFGGGVGIILYLAGWALLRSEDEAETPAERFLRGEKQVSAWIGIALVVVAGLILLGSFSFFSGKLLVALGLLAVGILLYTGHIPSPGPASADPGPLPPTDGSDHEPEPDHKEGVQPMTTTDTTTAGMAESPAGDSPAGGYTPPPATPPPTPTPPALPPAPPRDRSILGRLTMGVMLLSLGVLAILDNIAAIPIEADPRHYLALAVTVLGAGLLVGSVIGRARWLIIVGAVLVPTLLFSPAFEYDWSTGDFDVSTTPLIFTELESAYSIDVGNMVIDLTELPWSGQEIRVEASIDAGNLEIHIPDGVGIVGSASVNVGRVAEPGRSSSGLGDPNLGWDDPGVRGTVILDAHVDVGNIDIRR